MEFTHKSYKKMLDLLIQKGYKFCSYSTKETEEKCVILRHDVDFSVEKALEMAIMENEKNVKSTYFFLISTNFYNVFSKESLEMIMRIILLGHEIGLHFDEKKYNTENLEDMKKHVAKEVDILSELINRKVNVISMHRPSKLFLKQDVKFDGLINSYSSEFFNDMKYISDSRMNWRENPIAAIDAQMNKKLHILTHPFWYSVENESMEFKLKRFLREAVTERYHFLEDNFRELNKAITIEDVLVE
ncbi:hypothetical protein KQ939_00110 [Planococcus sp. CP5-4]|uniref:hypothetical protein n=1 Tax=unclassified Planococcus (in: firmicutes) TaxID=2662419 RepID=UPI001C2176B9|nr:MULTISPECIES: hypothetical protein [unclassified Planococcus (in: firmicutes)]MBU9675176.1 hypothetical protein [Planococcus sp. CP5-4_YE]MBV0908043.1 hypothetical protein [Planococcus sp. CP5-4_UN]MBW6062104.1 hypothetical protein [Planococcus sp. CP5-4]